MIFSIKKILRSGLFLLLFALLPSAGCKNPDNRGGELEEEEPVVRVVPKYAEMTPKRAATADSLRFYFDHLQRAGFNGTVLFAENGEIVFSKAYGYANLKTKDSLTMESAFQLASISKPITALAVLILKDDGKIGIDDPVKKYIPELPYPGITIRHLLTHRSGLPNYMYFAEQDWPNKEIPINNRDVIDLMVKNQYKPYYPPDKRYNYCNTNFALLAYIVEQVSGMKFEDFVQKRIFDPCHMVNSSIYNKNTSPVNTCPVVGYPTSRSEAENTFLNGVVGDKGVYCSAYDLLMLDKALYTDKPVSQATRMEAFTPQHKDLRPNDNYGLGWRLDVSDSLNPAIYHTGWWRGFRTYFIRELGEKRTIIILCNTMRASRFNSRELRERF
ncbi:MAG: serine hydrolase [Bacteroidia bacterium]|nr:serine hydrolase [Bacteroidia bacterium]